MKKIVIILTLVLAAAFVPGVTDAAQRPRWNTRVFSGVPGTGFAAYVYAHPNGRVYAANYTGTGKDKVRSRVFEWDSGGTLLRSWTVPGQKLDADHGVQVANSDARGRLVLLETSTASVLTLNIKNGVFKKQATLPDLPKVKGHPVPNYATWGPGGALYVTDYGQAVVWRIPAGGGKPTVWFASKDLEGVGFGTTGIVYRPSKRDFLVAQQTGGPGNPVAGKLYRLPVDKAGKPGKLGVLWRSRGTELPDGFGISKSGRIYVANVGLSNQLVVLSATGKELERFPRTTSGKNGSKIPFDGPSNATFVGTRILVVNQSPIAETRANSAILDVEVGEPGRGFFIPKSSKLR